MLVLKGNGAGAVRSGVEWELEAKAKARRERESAKRRAVEYLCSSAGAAVEDRRSFCWVARLVGAGGGACLERSGGQGRGGQSVPCGAGLMTALRCRRSQVGRRVVVKEWSGTGLDRATVREKATDVAAGSGAKKCLVRCRRRAKDGGHSPKSQTVVRKAGFLGMSREKGMRKA